MSKYMYEHTKMPSYLPMPRFLLNCPISNTAKLLYCYPAFYLVLNHPTFNQIKKKHGINYSDKFYIRLLYAVSFVLSYSLPHKKIAGLTLEKSGLLLLTHR